MSITTEHILTEATRVCTGCNELKWESEFSPTSYRCRPCRDEYQIAWREQNRTKINNNQRTYHATLRGRASVLLNAALKRARDKGDEFKLEIEDVIRGLSTGMCCKTFFPFDLSVAPRNGARYHINPYSPSIDKIDARGIYEPANVQYVCSWYNMAKGQMTDADLVRFCKRVAAVSK